MAWVRFKRDFDWRVPIRALVIHAYRGGRAYSVKASCARDAIAADAADFVDWRQTNRYEIFAEWRHRYAPGVTQNTEHVFSVCVPRDIPIILSPREHIAHAWLPYLEAADRCFSASNAEAILQLPRQLASDPQSK